jgi:hypothetical protein
MYSRGSERGSSAADAAQRSTPQASPFTVLQQLAAMQNARLLARAQ